MKFVLVDRIVELVPGERIVTEKALSLAEEYLADHFPKFPVLPGVFMLEAMVQAGAWLVREKLDFQPTIIVLKEARNVTYKSFLAPGRVMRVEADCKELGDQSSTFQARGVVGEKEMVKARFVLRHLTVSPDGQGPADDRLRHHFRGRFELLSRNALGPTPTPAL